MVKVKICGVTNLEDARKACEFGADLIGFIFAEGASRYIDPDRACLVIRQLRKMYSAEGLVGLFVDSEIQKVIDIVSHCDLDYVQLHGDEDTGYCSELKRRLIAMERPVQHRIIKVVKVKLGGFTGDLEGYRDVDYFVFDTYHPGTAGGTGIRFNWDVLQKERGNIRKDFFIAGGLDPANVAEAVKTVRPYGVDVSSGVESDPKNHPGKKDEKLLKEFIENAKKI